MKNKRLLWALACAFLLAGCDDSASSSSSETGNLCGNGIVDTDESCDDGNEIGGDGCAADCSAMEEDYD